MIGNELNVPLHKFTVHANQVAWKCFSQKFLFNFYGLFYDADNTEKNAKNEQCQKALGIQNGLNLLYANTYMSMYKKK